MLNTKTNEVKDVQAYPSLNLAVQPKDMKYRFNWNAPIVTSMHNPKVMYHAANVLLKTVNGGLSWDAISPDLTRNDKSKQGPGGVPFTNEGAGGENYNTIFYVKESPLDPNTIYTGSDCGLVNVTTDGGKTWTNITPKDLEECQINSIEASSFDKGVVYISATRYKLNDYASYTYKTTDNGVTWTKINNGVKDADFIKVIDQAKIELLQLNLNQQLELALAHRQLFLKMVCWKQQMGHSYRDSRLRPLRCRSFRLQIVQRVRHTLLIQCPSL